MKMKKWLFIPALALAIIAAFYIINNDTGNHICEGSSINVTLIIDFGNETWNFSVSLHDKNATVYGLLEEASRLYNFSYDATYYPQFRSYYIESINGVKNGVDGKYWQYWINGEYGKVGASNQILCDGDIVEWKWI
ncbi:MAG: DUF4430 domain-containing protein [Thermoplasmata archaeon]|nr:DUF4430 domain-containing protein [Thermoplasmata archaeon]